MTRQSTRRRPADAPNSLLLTPLQAAAELGIGRTAVYKLIQDGHLPAIDVCGLKVRRSDLELYILRKPTVTPTPSKTKNAEGR